MTNVHSDLPAAPTLEVVAARAAVSRATASRVLRGASNVSARARAAVEAAAEELSYTPNRAARSLVTGRSDSVAFYVDETEDRLFEDPFFLRVLRGTQIAIAQAGMQLVFSVASRPEDRKRFLQYAAGRHVDGVLLLSLHGDELQMPEQLESLGIPTVLSGRPLTKGADLFFVDADNIGGARLATRHLFDHDRRCVATVAGPADMCAGQDRLAGYVDSFHERGIAVRSELIVAGTFTQLSGYEAMRHLLEVEPRIDAVFAGSDLMAIGAMRAIEASGRRVFDDVAVVGFDDIGDAETATPPLTTVRQPMAEIGRSMADVLVSRLSGDTPAARGTILPVELIQRESA